MQGATKCSMASDDATYALLLVLSIPIGLVFRVIRHAYIREIVAFITGVCMITIVCREHSLHFLIVASANFLIILIASELRYLPIISFLWCFLYLAFFRTCHWFGVPKPSPHSNAVQLLLTLRLVGLASEVCDFQTLKRLERNTTNHDQTLALKLKYKRVEFSFYRMAAYTFAYLGILTGPFYTFRTYQDMISRQNFDKVPLYTALKQTTKPLPLCILVFIILSMCVSVKEMTKDEFYTDSTFVYRYGYLCLMFTWFRVRFYSAWILAECMAITAGLGAYPTAGKNKPGGGPSDLEALEAADDEANEYDFITIQNILPYDVEFGKTVRSALKTWNMTVQWWLAVNVYKRIPASNKFIRGLILMAISAFWHGIHPGYYATFLSAPFLLAAEDGMIKGLKSRIKSDRINNIYDLIASFLRIRFFEYMSIGFFLLQFEDIWRFWSSVYFFGHIALTIVILLGLLLSLSSPSKKTD